ncbi:MAG: hypothetical protein AAGF12_11430 [Myxococcota bacterium]
MRGLTWSVPVLLLGLAGCAASTGEGPELPTSVAPAVTALTTNTAAVGDDVTFMGNDFVPANEGWVDMHFVGAFYPDNGSAPVAVDLRVPLETNPDGSVTWRNFGGTRVPFIEAGNQTGNFEGQVYATNFYYDTALAPAEQEETSRIDISFGVVPSIVVLDNRAFGDTFIADCKEPALQVLETARYGFRVAAVGFEPARWNFVLSPGLIVDDVVQTDTTELSYAADGQEFGLIHSWSPVPSANTGYRASISVQVESFDGLTRELEFPFAVRRPVEVYFQGPPQIAEIMQPEPVSGCIPGGPSSVQVSYSETTSETRTRSTSRALQRGWANTYSEAHQETHGASVSEGYGETRTQNVTTADTTSEGGSTSMSELFSNSTGRNRATNVSFSSTESDQIGVAVGREEFRSTDIGLTLEQRVSGEVGVPLVANGKVELGAKENIGRSWGSRDNTTVNGSQTSANTGSAGVVEGETETETRARTYASSNNWGVSQTRSESNGFNTSRNINQSRSFNEALTTSASATENLGQTDTEVLTVSTTQTESLGIEAWVWAGQQGMWYRQTTRFVRFGSVVAYDLCGNGTQVGTVELNDWSWAPDLAIGDSCPPPSNLPEAECRISPCE